MKKRRIRGNVFAVFFSLILISILAYKIPHFLHITRLQDLGYSEESIRSIYSKKLRKEILKNGYYSDYLNEEVNKDSFDPDYLKLYTLCDDLNEDVFYLYDFLLNKYSVEELEELFASLKYEDLTALAVLDKVDAKSYITDVKPDGIIDGDYLDDYADKKEVTEIGIETYVSRKTDLGNYEAEKLVKIPVINAVDNCFLESKALEAYNEMCSAIREEGTGIYAVAAYISYDSQKNLASSYTKDDHNYRATLPGFADAQLGLSVQVVSGENESVANFKDTKAYEWMMEHAHEYGFIQRYPQGKEAVTGIQAMDNYFRFVGKDLAKKVFDSGLTFDEYYYLYLN